MKTKEDAIDISEVLTNVDKPRVKVPDDGLEEIEIEPINWNDL